MMVIITRPVEQPPTNMAVMYCYKSPSLGVIAAQAA